MFCTGLCRLCDEIIQNLKVIHPFPSPRLSYQSEAHLFWYVSTGIIFITNTVTLHLLKSLLSPAAEAFPRGFLQISV